MRYRPEVDGLRAVAVLPVILFHAGVEAFRGGFVGVDVFFVISGYLITGLLLADLEAGRFSLARFYERRARRILPALFFVALVSLALAWHLLMPGTLRDFARSVAAVGAFGSNILFWLESGYFGTEAELKPLLHTWSLAVEEQYYLLFPLLLALLWRGGRRLAVAGVGAVGLASFALAAWLAPRAPNAAFFLLPTRAWELALGALAAAVSRDAPLVRLPRGTREGGAVLGLGLILGSVLFLDASARFPGPWAVAPTVGTAVVILLADQRTWVGRLLSHRALVGIGLISYSAYLWHHVLFAFARHAGLASGGYEVFVPLIGATLLLAYLSWRFVETPFRDPARISRRAVVALAVTGSLLLVGVGMAGVVMQGVPGRLSPDRRAFLEAAGWREDPWEGTMPSQPCNFYDIASRRAGGETRVPLPRIGEECHVRDSSRKHAVLVWGDSHARHLQSGLAATLPPDWQLLMVASPGCRARLESGPSATDYCRHSNWFAWHTAKTAKPEVVVVAHRDRHQPAEMRRIAAALLEAGVHRVVFPGPIPEWSPELAPLVVFRMWDRTPQRTWLGVKRKRLEEDLRLRTALTAVEGVTYVSLTDQLCDGDGCLVYHGTDRARGLTTYDYGHFTAATSRLVAERALVPVITRGGDVPAKLPLP